MESYSNCFMSGCCGGICVVGYFVAGDLYSAVVMNSWLTRHATEAREIFGKLEMAGN